MKIIVASGVESRPARRSAGDRDGHGHGTILKSDREHGRAGGIGAFEKSQPFLAEIDLHDATPKEILSQQTVDTARGRRIDLPQIENEDVIAQAHVTNLRGESADPASFGTMLDSDHPNGWPGSQALELPRCIRIQGAHAGARVEDKSQRSARRRRFDGQANHSIAQLKGDFRSRPRPGRDRQEHRHQRNQEKPQEHRRILQRVRLNFNSRSANAQKGRKSRQLEIFGPPPRCPNEAKRDFRGRCPCTTVCQPCRWCSEEAASARLTVGEAAH
jgi:hypothetical protein